MKKATTLSINSQPFTNHKTRRFAALLAALLCLALPMGKAWGQQTLTVYDESTTCNTAPMYVFYFDDWSRAQTVYPATDLSDMNGGSISAITFYTKSDYIPYTTVATFDIYLTEVNSTSISAYVDKSSATTVFTNGTGSFVSDGNGGGMITITFSTPYQYNGGNLLFGCDNTTDAGYKNITFKGKSATGASISGSNGTAGGTIPVNARNFLPKTTFTYTPQQLASSYTVTASADPTAGGSVKINGQSVSSATITTHDNCMLKATPAANSSYAFTYWTDNGTIVSYDAEYTLTDVTRNHAMVAHFAQPLIITTTAEWNTFCTNVSNGTSYAGQLVKLGADVKQNSDVCSCFC